MTKHEPRTHCSVSESLLYAASIIDSAVGTIDKDPKSFQESFLRRHPSAKPLPRLSVFKGTKLD